MAGDQDRASLASAIRAVLTLPALAALAVPLLLGWLDPWSGDANPEGLTVVGLGALVVYSTVRAFFTQGRGTLAPWDPPRRLVTTGLFARVRNPMYIGVLVVVAGWAVTFRSPLVALYVSLLALGFHLRVVLHEESWAVDTFGDEWTRYRGHVPRWIPRVRPWNPPE